MRDLRQEDQREGYYSGLVMNDEGLNQDGSFIREEKYGKCYKAKIDRTWQ